MASELVHVAMNTLLWKAACWNGYRQKRTKGLWIRLANRCNNGNDCYGTCHCRRWYIRSYGCNCILGLSLICGGGTESP